MIIESIRLKNIKSYGDGPTGTGVTIPFENGVNRVAGRNGHGKTTLIESVGYALFVTKPQFEENFQTETYFLSHGAKEGEIDVTFSCEGQSYRIERTIGKQTKLRSKVIQLSDLSICAEGDEEVSDFLCRLLNFPDPGQLSEIFYKLVGVKQGRLAWPFDSKPNDAKRHFEPLLEVDVFRDCFDRLKGAVDTFKAQRDEHLIKQAGITERIQERASTPETLASARQKVATTTTALSTANQLRDAALKLKEQLETAAKAMDASRNAVGAANQKTTHAKTLCEAAAVQFGESTGAVKTLAVNEVAHLAHTAAVQTLGQLEKQREQRDTLKQQRDTDEADRVNCQNKSVAARDQAKEFSGQSNSKQKERDALVAKLTPLQTALAASAGVFNKSAKAAEAAQDHRDTLGGWIDSLTGLARSQKLGATAIARLAKEISTWDATKLKSAETAEKAATKVFKDTEAKLAKAEERHETLKEQLKEIGGGICPFLKERCRQFDPAKVSADLKEQTSAISGLKQEVAKAEKVHDAAERALGELRTTQGRITGKETELSGLLEGYREELLSVNSDEAAAALAWLLAWEPQLSTPPQAPTVPARRIDPVKVASLQQQLETFASEARAWWEKSDAAIKARLKAFQEEAKGRESQEATLREQTAQSTGLKQEVQRLNEKAAVKETEAKQHDAQAAGLVMQLGKFDDTLKPFANLDADLKREQQKRDAHQAGHERYLGAAKLAAELSARQARLTQLQADEATALKELQAATAAVQKAEQDFDPEKLITARADHQSKHDHATELKVNLEAEQESLKKETQRFQEWEAACQERDRVAVEIGRCDAAMELTELARRTLRDTAPAVAQHLCSRIATRAQGVFNQINPDAIELTWDAERYSLRITPGDRHFAMLSGGEQTKLALAMTLAMIKEFSGLRFCIFDEPTYGVDAESRHKLADAILQMQETAGLDQLLLVSHDDAFEGKIEHAILLEKSAATGTKVALSQ